MILKEMDTVANPLSVLIEKDTFVHDKSESDPSSAFIDYNGWMTNDFNFDTDTVLSPCKTLSSPSDQPQVLEWTPHEGRSNDTISVILEQPPSEKMRGPIKIAFGQQVIDTSCDTQFVPVMEDQQQQQQQQQHQSLGGVDSSLFSTTWVTLTAKVPMIESMQLGLDSQVPVSLWFYDYERQDLVVDTWTIGSFTFLDNGQTPPARKKRSLSSQSIEDYPQKRPYQASSDSEDLSNDNQLLQLLAPYKDPLVEDQTFSVSANGDTQNDNNTALWIAQQLQQQQQPQRTQKQPQSQPAHQQHLIGNVNTINASFMDGLPLDFPSVPSNGMNMNQSNYYRQNVDPGIQNLVYDGFSNTNMIQRNCYPLNAPINQNGGNQCGGNYQNDGMNYHGQNHDTMIPRQYFNNSGNGNRNDVFSPTGGVMNNTMLSNPMHNNMNYYNNGMQTNSNNMDPNGGSGGGVGGKYNMAGAHPFAGLLNKANLKICGDLMEMTFQWSANEWQCGRRLVRFWRRQNTNNVENSQQVECRFQPIEYYAHHQEQQHQQQHQQLHLSDRQYGSMSAAQASLNSPISPLQSTHGTTGNSNNSNSSNNNNTTVTTSSLVVSCIYWREQNDYFITSVDCIYLLEGLIGVQFTVEEKNRIRRNLEGFRPLTVSKCKSDCADFFKMIMGFPHPKPRNIEKDVKVFAWRILPQALRKIIRKYNLSSSSSSTNMPPPSTTTTTASIIGPSASLGNPSPVSLSSHVSPTSMTHSTFGQQQQQQQHHHHHRNHLQQRQYCY